MGIGFFEECVSKIKKWKNEKTESNSLVVYKSCSMTSFPPNHKARLLELNYSTLKR